MTKPFSLTVQKPWGYEIILTPKDTPFTGKLAHTSSGHRWSYQYHEQKKETIVLLEGEATLWIDDGSGEIKKIKMEEKKGYLIKPYVKHRLCADTDCLTLEVSTPEVGKTIRLEDDYNRGSESEKERELRKEGVLYTG